ncbi:MAG: isoleucine--tRNA ligase [bacterium]|nr:isoleucine--tRNA ligase [bacterium]
MMNFSHEEEEILNFWDTEDIFNRSIANREGGQDFVFYDGPPFATGLPHHGHILASTAKDLIGRYKTMQGYRVLRRWGWDCHGLPLENLCEKELGISGKKEIEEYGIDKFNNACESSVLKFDKEWEKMVRRIGRFVNFKDSYKTMDRSYMESVWWGFSQLYTKGLIYKDTRISLYCPRCETPLSNFEIAMDNSYRDVKDPSVYVAYKLKDVENQYLLVWTTTPWTLPANAAIAISPNLEYLRVVSDFGKTYIVAKELYPRLKEMFGNHHLLDSFPASTLIGRSYEPLFDYFTPKRPRTFTVLAGDFVSAQDGTGLVHIAPAFGEDDYRIGKDQDIDFFESLDSQSRFVPEVKAWAGKMAWNINQNILDALVDRGHVLKVESIMHSYPFCWRCETKLLYKTQPAWFVKVADIKDRMITLNEDISWHPDHLQHGRFGKGLETAPDWNISRSRYWGNPMPIWECEACEKREIFDSLEKLEMRAGHTIGDLHRPDIDEVTFKCECGGVAKRIPEVFDCWFESGSMPWASIHYPFENKDFFENNFPAEFISEYIAQTRGWFYTLHVLSVGIFDRPAFRNAVTTGTIAARNGQKMSKSKNNYTPPIELINKYGVDSMRYYLMASSLMNAENLNYKDEDQADAFRKIILLLWNVYTFYDTYRQTRSFDPEMKSDDLVDRWIDMKMAILARDVAMAYDNYAITKGTRLIGEFINDLSTWYVRRSRDRFKSEDSAEQEKAMATLHRVLVITSKVIAPVTPFIADMIYTKIETTHSSVHLCDWPTFDATLIDETLNRDMDAVRQIVEKTHALRSGAGIKLRQPLASLIINQELRTELCAIIADEVNVKSVTCATQIPDGDGWVCDEAKSVGLQTVLDQTLKDEGLLRDIVRQINALRKEKGLTIQDRIIVTVAGDEDIGSLIDTHSEGLLGQVLATSIKIVTGDDHMSPLKLDGSNIRVALEKDV